MEQIALKRATSKANVLLLLAAGMLVLAVTQKNPHWACGAVLPLLWGLVIRFWGRWKGEADLREDGLYDSQGECLARYHEILGLSIHDRTPNPDAGRFPAGTLNVICADRVVVFPQLRKKSAKALYESLLDQVPLCGSRQLRPPMDATLAAERKLFDDDLIKTYTARPRILLPHTAQLGVFLVSLLVGVLWGVAGVYLHEGWFAGTIATVALGLLGPLFLRGHRKGSRIHVKNPDEAMLLIGPRGLALNQGKLQGKLRWDEIREVVFGETYRWGMARQHQSFSLTLRSHAPGILLKLAGTEVEIHDIYDRPLAVIYQVIDAYRNIPTESTGAAPVSAGAQHSPDRDSFDQ